MGDIPRDLVPESILLMLMDPYRFISRRCRRKRIDVFCTRLMGRKTICMTGADAAELFYNEERFQRSGVPTLFLQNTLFGFGGIQTTDGEEHKRRKQAFMSLLTPEAVARLVDRTARIWGAYLERWSRQREIVFYPEIQRVFAEAVCRWSGVPIEGRDVEERTAQLALLFDRAASPGLGHVRARRARYRAQRWIGRLVDRVRHGEEEVSPESPLAVFARYVDAAGKPLDAQTAAVEVINLLRPTVAVSVYAVFSALAVYKYPECREKLVARVPGYDQHFVQEVRRFFPFFPAIIALTRMDFEWKGYRFPKGWPVVLDLYGINHDPRAWEKPGEFRPERFDGFAVTPFNFVPQGGGDYLQHHRCAGEAATIELAKLAVDFLVRRMDYTVPKQDLVINMRRLPALPKSRFVMSNVGRAEV